MDQSGHFEFPSKKNESSSNLSQFTYASNTSQISGRASSTTGSASAGGRRLLHSTTPSHSNTIQSTPPATPSKQPQPSTPEPAVSTILQTLFSNFVHVADDKLDSLLYYNLDKDEDLALFVKQGTDPDFDRLMSSLGSIAKHSPKLIIDSIMIWRKSKSDPNNSQILIPDEIRQQYSTLKPKDLEAIVKERKSLISNFILCRGLIEILEHLDKGTLPAELGEKMEDMIFGQLRNVDADLNVRFANRHANTDFFSQLAGSLSRIRFATVSDRFIAEIGKIDSVSSSNQNLKLKTSSNASKETKLEIFIRCMRYLKLTVYPMDALEETAEFLAVCAEIFQNSHSIRIKHAYCRVFIDLLEPIAAVASAEVNLPTWQQTVELIYSKATKMLSKPRHYHAVIPLITTLLCVSRQDFFLRNWSTFTDNLLQKLKDKSLKATALSCLCRLIWVYLFRCSEPDTTTQRRLEVILRVIFPPGKKSIFPVDCHNAFFTQIVYFVLVKFPEFGCQMLLPYLLGQPSHSQMGDAFLGSGTVMSGTGTSAIGTERLFSLSSTLQIQNMDDMSSLAQKQPEIFADLSFGTDRLVIAVNAFLLFLSDVEDALGSDSDQESGFTSGAVSAVRTEEAFIVVEAKLNLSAPAFPRFRMDAGLLSEFHTSQSQSKEKDQSDGDLRTGMGLMDVTKDIRSVYIPSTLSNRFSQNIRKMMGMLSDIVGRVFLLFESSNGMQGLADSSTLANVGSSLQVGSSSQDTKSSTRRPSVPNISQPDLNNTASAESIKTHMHSVLNGIGDKVAAECLCHILDSLPRLVPHGLSASHIIEYVSRCVFHVNEHVRASASDALVRIASINERKIPEGLAGDRFWSLESPLHSVAAEVTQIFSDTAFQIVGSKYVDISAINSLHELISELFISNYMSLLDVVLKDLSGLDSEVGSRPLTDYQLECILDEIESRGILLLCTSIPSVRQSGMEILKMAATFESTLSHQTKSRRWGTTTAHSFVKEDALGNGTGGSSMGGNHTMTTTLARLSKLRGSTLTTLKRKNSRTASQTSTTGRILRAIHLLREGGPELIRRYAPSLDVQVTIPVDPSSGPSSTRTLTLHDLINDRDCLILLACAIGDTEASLWNRCFPHLVHYLFHNMRHEAIEACLLDVFARLQVFHPTIVYSTDMYQVHSHPGSRNVSGGSASNVGVIGAKWMNASSSSLNDRKSVSSGGNANGNVTSGSGYERIFEQWRQYLIFCTICMDAHQNPGTGMQSAFLGPTNNMGNNNSGGPGIWRSHSLIKRDKKNQPQPSPVDLDTFAYDSLRNICRSVLPFLSCDRVAVRNAAVVALGNISSDHYDVLVEEIILHLQGATQDMLDRLGTNPNTKRASSMSQTPHRSRKLNRVRMELTRLLAIISDFVTDVNVRTSSSGYMKSIVEFISVSVEFLSDPEVQVEWEYQMFRYYFCGFVDRLYSNLAETLGEEETAESGADVPSVEVNNGFAGETPETYINVSLRVRLFDLFESWSGFSSLPELVHKRDQAQLNSILEPIKDARERAKVHEIMEEQKQALENAALKAMAAVCKGVLTDPQIPSIAFDRKRILVWTDALLASQQPKVRAVARSALHSLLRFNVHDDVLFEEMLWRCWDDTESFSNHVYFNSFVDFVSKLKKIDISPAKVVSLALFQMGNRRSHMRRCAARLLIVIDRHLLGFDLFTSGLAASVMNMYYDEYCDEGLVGYDEPSKLNRRPLHDEDGEDHHGDDDFLKEVQTTYESAAVTSSLPIVYRYAQRTISARLAREQPQLTVEMLSELAKRTNRLIPTRVLSDVVFRDLLDVTTPWVANVNIETNFRLEKLNVDDPEAVQKAATTFMILNNLLYLTIRLGDIHITEVEALWQQLLNPYVPSNSNGKLSGGKGLSEDELRGRMATIIDFILMVGVMKQNLHIINHLKKISIYFCRTRGCSAFIDTIMSLLTPASLAPPSSDDIKELNLKMWQIRGSFYLFSLEDVMPTQTERPVISIGQLALTFLVDAAIEIPPFTFRPHLPVILHLIIIQLDHFLRVFCEQSRTLLVNLIQAVLPRESERERIDATLTALHLKEGKRLWAYEDATPGEPEPRSVEQLCALSLELVELFSAVHPTLNQAWGELALYWGSTCPIRHLAARSLQMYRAFRPVFHRRMLGDVLSRLSVTVCDPSPDVQGFAYELLLTTECMLQSIETGLFLAFPQFFWVSVTLFQSGLEWEFEKGLQLLDKILVCLLLEDNIWPLKLTSAFPTRWKGEFLGIQPLLLKGLESRHTEALTVKLLDKCISIDESKLVNPSSSRLMLSILATVPLLLEQFSQHDYTFGFSSQTIAETLHIELSKAKLEDLARLYDSYAKRKFRLKGEFIRQLVSLLKKSFFPVYEDRALLLCMNMLRNPREGFRRCVLEFLKQLFPDMRSAGTNVDSPGSPKMNIKDNEWIMPLVSLLNTPFAKDASEVLDAVMSDKIKRDETDLRFVFGSKSMRTIAEANPRKQKLGQQKGIPITSKRTSSLGSVAELIRPYSHVPSPQQHKWVSRADSLTANSELISSRRRSSGSRGRGLNNDSVSESGWCIQNLDAATKTCRYNMSAVALTCTGGQGIYSVRQPERPSLAPSLPKTSGGFVGPKAAIPGTSTPSAFTSMPDGSNTAARRSRLPNHISEELRALLPVLDDLESYFASAEPPTPPPDS